MKKIILLLMPVILLSSFSVNPDRFTIKGVIRGNFTGKAFLQRYQSDRWVDIDSVKIVEGNFAFSGRVDLPEMYHISVPDQDVVLPLFVENSAINVVLFSDSVEKSQVKGSETHAIYKKYVVMNDAIEKRMEDVSAGWKTAKEAGDSAEMKRLDSESEMLDKEQKEQLTGFIRANGKSVVAPYLITRNSWQFELPELESLAAGFDPAVGGSVYMASVNKRIGILRKVQIGCIAPDFTMNDSTGKPVKLSSLKGKVLLVDFWASWCGPCRGENPNVVKAYKAYHDKGFDVLGCSFDKDRKKWLKAVKDDDLTWQHVSDLKGWGNAAGQLYGVNSIPANVLLDKNQKIIGRNLRGEELLKKLEEVLGKTKP